MRRLFSGPGELDADDAAERHRSAAGHAGGEVRVFVREEAPAVVPDHVEPGMSCRKKMIRAKSRLRLVVAIAVRVRMFIDE